MSFTLIDKVDKKMQVTLSIDGFSGRYTIDGIWGDRRISNAEEVRDWIYSVLNDALDKGTATV